MHTERPVGQLRTWLAALLCLGVCASLLFCGALQYQWPGERWQGAEVLSLSGDSLVLVRGRGYADRGRLTIDGLADPGVAVASLNTAAFRAERYPTVRWSLSSSGPGAGPSVEFAWRSSAHPGRTFARRIEWAGKGAAPLRMDGDENWRGEITGLALIVHPPLDARLIVAGVELEPFSPLRVVWREWFAAQQWLGTSINFVAGNEQRQWLAPLPFAAGALGSAMLLYGLIARRRRLAPAGIWALLFCAWFVLDMRWQVDLWHKLGFSHERYAGKTWREKHLAAEDGRLFDLLTQMRAKLPPAAARVFLFADDEYIRGRAAYHLYPFNVRNARDLLPAEKFRPGDFIVILGKDEVGYDASTRLLTWEPQQSLSAELLLLAEGNVLLRVR